VTAEALKKEEIEVATRLMEDLPDSPSALALAGTVHSRLGNSAKAAKYWEKCLELDPRHAEVHHHLGWIALRKGQHEKAAALFRKALEISPNLPGVHYRLACAMMFLGRSADAIAPLEKEIQISPKAAESHYLLGQAHLQLNECELAKKNYEAALRIRPDHRNACYGLAIVCARLGEREHARAYRERFKKLKAKELRALIDESESFDDLAAMQQRLATTHTGAGQVCHKHGHHRKAEAHWRRAATVDPKNVACRKLLASMYQSSNRERDALEMREQLREIDPEDAINWLNIGVLNARLQQFAAAEKAFRKAVELAPQSSQGYRALAVLRLRTRKGLSEARTLAHSAVKLEPSVSNYLLLSRICYENGDRASAVAAMKRVVELDPGNRRYRQMLRALQARR